MKYQEISGRCVYTVNAVWKSPIKCSVALLALMISNIDNNYDIKKIKCQYCVKADIYSFSGLLFWFWTPIEQLHTTDWTVKSVDL